MKRLVTSTAVLCVLSGAGPVHAQEPDFSGMWTLDREASEFNRRSAVDVAGRISVGSSSLMPRTAHS